VGPLAGLVDRAPTAEDVHQHAPVGPAQLRQQARGQLLERGGDAVVPDQGVGQVARIAVFPGRQVAHDHRAERGDLAIVTLGPALPTRLEHRRPQGQSDDQDDVGGRRDDQDDVGGAHFGIRASKASIRLDNSRGLNGLTT
jgi:hypothetical protein